MNTLPPFPGLAETPMAFKAELCRIAERNGWDPAPIATVMFLEGSKYRASTKNSIGAVGLIQFMPSTAKALGTTTNELAAMSELEQLKFVEKYFKMVGLPAGARTGDYYIATFLPGFMGKSDATVMSVAGEKIYDGNKGLDRNKDGVITVGDVRGYLENTLAQFKTKPQLAVDMTVQPSSPFWVWAAGIGAAAWYFRKHLGIK